MIGLLQRVSEANVSIAGEIVGAIDRGLLVLVGVEKSDTEAEAETRAYTPPIENEGQSETAEADQADAESDTPPRGDQQ